MDDWERSARESIRQTLALYHHGGDAGDYDRLGSAFAEDGVLIRGDSGAAFEGRKSIVDALKARAAERGFQGQAGRLQRHHLTTSNIEFVSPSEAAGTSYFMVITELGLDHAGTYQDQFRQIGDRWLISRRHVQKDWIRADSRYVTKR